MACFDVGCLFVGLGEIGEFDSIILIHGKLRRVFALKTVLIIISFYCLTIIKIELVFPDLQVLEFAYRAVLLSLMIR